MLNRKETREKHRTLEKIRDVVYAATRQKKRQVSLGFFQLGRAVFLQCTQRNPLISYLAKNRE